ncbi:hypothetical protein L282_3119 [Escherichia coli APEC IMT5155]|nr:hypothetical protein L282_3119 [Escherichia coli APEC IMT5155]
MLTIMNGEYHFSEIAPPFFNNGVYYFKYHADVKHEEKLLFLRFNLHWWLLFLKGNHHFSGIATTI